MLRRTALSMMCLLLFGGAPADRAQEREMMVASVRNLAAATGLHISRPVLDALRAVPRHLFVLAELAGKAYENRPLPIGNGQTISQPFIVALMTELLKPDPGDAVLEVGTGSGYQAAVLSGLVKRVYSIEIVAPLARQSAARLAALGYDNVVVRSGDGYAGWPEHAPFNAIIVTAGADHVPPPLVAQLERGGRMVIPVGPTLAEQQLLLIEKRRDGSIRRRVILPVAFVPLTRSKRR